MGYRTTLPVREERRITDGGVERLKLRTDLDKEGKWHYLEPKQHLRKEEVKSEFKGMISDDLSEALVRMDRHRSDAVVTRMLQIEERPGERGQAKHGPMAGIRGLKFEGKSYVLLYSAEEKEKVVLFYGYYHHDVAYDAKKISALIANMRFIPLHDWIAEQRK